jgi:hypothetical protein
MSMAADDRYFAAPGTNSRYRDDGRGSAIVLDNPAPYNAVLRDFLGRHLLPAATARPYL